MDEGSVPRFTSEMVGKSCDMVVKGHRPPKCMSDVRQSFKGTPLNHNSQNASSIFLCAEFSFDLGKKSRSFPLLLGVKKGQGSFPKAPILISDGTMDRLRASIGYHGPWRGGGILATLRDSLRVQTCWARTAPNFPGAPRVPHRAGLLKRYILPV